MAYYSANLKYLGDAVKNTKVAFQYDGIKTADTEQTGVNSTGLAYQTLEAGVAKAYGTRAQKDNTASQVKGQFYTDWSYGISPLSAQNNAGLNV